MSATPKNLLMIGCGNMGAPVLSAILDHEIFQAADTQILERYPNDYTKAFSERGCSVVEAASEVTTKADVAFIAVKPQDSAPTFELLKPLLAEGALVVSIMAGVSLTSMKEQLGDVAIIRSMPNTPASIHLGMTGYVGNDLVSEAQYKLAHQMFSGLGKALKLDKEEMIDAVTAISGSGPAYVFYLAEAMAEGAREMGFSAEDAKLLSNQTLLGASSLLSQSTEEAADLRAKVTSKGGTTYAALSHFEDCRIKDLLKEGFEKALERSQELGRS